MGEEISGITYSGRRLVGSLPSVGGRDSIHGNGEWWNSIYGREGCLLGGEWWDPMHGRTELWNPIYGRVGSDLAPFDGF